MYGCDSFRLMVVMSWLTMIHSRDSWLWIDSPDGSLWAMVQLLVAEKVLCFSLLEYQTAPDLLQSSPWLRHGHVCQGERHPSSHQSARVCVCGERVRDIVFHISNIRAFFQVYCMVVGHFFCNVKRDILSLPIFPSAFNSVAQPPTTPLNFLLIYSMKKWLVE